MKKKILLLCAITMMSLGLVGCCISHDWQEATCNAPETCAKCGKTKGEVLTHVPGKEANYQSGQLCDLCGTEISEKLPADFETYGVALKGSTQEVPFTTVTSKGTATSGTVSFTVDEPTQANPSGEVIEGYEWIHATMQIKFSDDAAQLEGATWGNTTEDYYNIDLHDTTMKVVDDNPEANYLRKQYSVNYYGEVYDQCIYTCQYMENGWDSEHVFSCYYDYYFCVPVGYDGAVIGLYSGATTWQDGQHIYDIADDNTILFKLR